MDYQSFQPNPKPDLSLPELPPPHQIFTHKFIGVILILVALGAGASYGIWMWGNQQATKSSTPCIKSICTNSIPPSCWCDSTGMDTKNWKTYTNPQYGFEFKYPAEYSDQNVIGQYGVQTISFFDQKGDDDLKLRFQVSIDNDISSGADPLTVLKEQPDKIFTGPKDFKIGNDLAEKYQIKWEYRNNIHVHDFAVLEKGDKIYTFSNSGLRPDRATFYQILSTFRFVK
ncbi:MAG: hypothetical protein HYT64_01610 [Candidatus Yanofskybacteria bacterium]|nr:hypothetical protein [Candidatus Yanofskybacteria bacterium]